MQIVDTPYHCEYIVLQFTVCVFVEHVICKMFLFCHCSYYIILLVIVLIILY